MPIQIRADRGVVYLDENKARCSKYPLEPLFRSIYFINPEFDPRFIDVVTDRKNLRKLLKIICGKSVQDFHIDLELVGETLLFSRWENSAKSYINDAEGYGHEFEKALGTYPKSLRRSTSHHRVIRYSLAGMTILLRFEADGYLPSKNISTVSSSKPVVRQRHSANAPIRSYHTNSHPAESSIDVIHAGHDVPHSSLVELKTCYENKGLSTSKVIDQLWFGQARNLKIGYHNDGTFKRIDERDIQENEEFQRFGRTKGQDLRKMINVIENIRKLMKELGIVDAVLICEEGSLHLYKKQNCAHTLPQDLLSRWNSPPDHESPRGGLQIQMS